MSEVARAAVRGQASSMPARVGPCSAQTVGEVWACDSSSCVICAGKVPPTRRPSGHERKMTTRAALSMTVAELSHRAV